MLSNFTSLFSPSRPSTPFAHDFNCVPQFRRLDDASPDVKRAARVSLKTSAAQLQKPAASLGRPHLTAGKRPRFSRPFFVVV